MAQHPPSRAVLIRAVEIQIEKQIEVVAAAVCDGRNFEQPVLMLDRLAQVLEGLEAENPDTRRTG